MALLDSRVKIFAGLGVGEAIAGCEILPCAAAACWVSDFAENPKC